MSAEMKTVFIFKDTQRDGLTVDQAQERAIAVLVDGLSDE